MKPSDVIKNGLLGRLNSLLKPFKYFYFVETTCVCVCVYMETSYT